MNVFLLQAMGDWNHRVNPAPSKAAASRSHSETLARLTTHHDSAEAFWSARALAPLSIGRNKAQALLNHSTAIAASTLSRLKPELRT